MNTTQLLNRLYPKALKRPCRALRAVRGAGRWTRKNALNLGLGAALILLWVVGHLYYYNKLVDLECNVQEGWAQVESQWQRRYHIQQNVTLLVGEYSRHERELMLRLTTLRQELSRTAEQGSSAGGAPGSAPSTAAASSSSGTSSSRSAPVAEEGASAGKSAPGVPEPSGALAADGAGLGGQLAQLLEEISPEQLNKLFPQIRLVAEQYPQLRASENFQQFSQAIIDTETKIADQVMSYNKAVNIYTTVLQQFPANVFGKVCGFPLYQFYSPEKESLRFRELTYKIQD